MLDRLRTDPEWLPPSNVELEFLVAARLRSLQDDSLGNRWLHHRWASLFNDLYDDLDSFVALRDGFTYVCMGPGSRNPFAFPLLVFLAGAGRVWLVEPEWEGRAPGGWRGLWGLQEMALRVLAGDVAAGRVSRDPARLDEFAPLGDLFFGSGQLDKTRVHVAPVTIEEAPIPDASVHLLTSRSVLEHVLDFERCAATFARIMAPGGVMHHDVDLSAHRTDSELAFYYEPSAHKRLNMLRLSDYLAVLDRHGFDSSVLRRTDADPQQLDRGALTERFAHYADDDLLCTAAVIVSRKQETP